MLPAEENKMDALIYGVTLVGALTYQALSVVLNIWIVSSTVGILVGVQIVRGLYAKKVGPCSIL